MRTIFKIANGSTFQEGKNFLKLAIPLVGAQIAQSLTGFCDTIMMGRLGAETIAAGGLASWTFIATLNVAGGLVLGISPLVAEAYGAGQKKRIETLTRQGFWLVLFLAIPTILMIPQLDEMMLHLGQIPSTVMLAKSYLDWIIWGFFPALSFILLRGVVSSLSQTRPIVVIVTCGTGFNILGNYLLGFGKFGFPRLELAGLAIASSLTWWGMLIALVIYLLKQPQLKSYKFFSGMHKLRPAIIWELCQTGVPIGVFMALELGLFTVITYLMGTLGTEVLAAHQIVFQTIMVTFMIPLGMSYAATVRVGQWFGKKDLAGVKRAGYVSIGLGFGIMSLLAIAMLIFPKSIIAIYLDTNDPANESLIALVLPMFAIASLSQILDAVQKITYGALQGVQDIRVPVFLNILAFWGVGLGSGYWLGFTLGLSGIGLWLGQSLGIALSAILFFGRFFWQTNRLTQSILLKK